ncbi:MAG: hypothetical protein ACI91B_001890 [Planctomycetota bacterium]|jgi:hypothetical protein
MSWPSLWRGPAGLTFRHCLRTSTAPTAIALLIAVIANAASEPDILDGSPAAASTPWLTLPLVVIAIACCLCAAHTWPTFARRQPGADTVRRLERSPLGGRGAVIAGALLAQFALSLPLAIGLSAWFDAPSHARRHYEVIGPEYAILQGKGDSVTFQVTDGAIVDAIWMRPRASLPTGEGDTEVTITAGGKRLASTPLAFSESGALLRVAIQQQPLSQFKLTQTAGSIPLYFAPKTVTAVGPADLPTWANSLLLALIATFTSAITLAIAALIGLGTGWATLATTICCLQFVQWIGNTGPIGDALLAVMRGQWLL